MHPYELRASHLKTLLHKTSTYTINLNLINLPLCKFAVALQIYINPKSFKIGAMLVNITKKISFSGAYFANLHTLTNLALSNSVTRHMIKQRYDNTSLS